ncbi:MAG: bifunctional acetate--CoA ligase family protein/GNAT family N-acetyltransferase [Chloroflexota bacterium]
MDALFKPKSVAVVGATERENAVGRTILYNLVSNPFGGVVYPINPGRESVLGVKAYKSITDCPGPVDMVVIVTPAHTVPGIVQEAVDNGVKGAIIISAGFKERGPEGVAMEEQIMDIARGKMRIIGPNCLGVMNPIGGMNATFAGAQALKGNIGFLSQSGAMCTSVLDYSFEENIGFSAFVSVGSMLDVDWGDMIYYLGDDPNTKAIVIYMETVGNARSFLSAAREVALKKPIIVVKPGRTQAAAAAAASHTGSLTGSDEVLDAAFRRVGVLRVDTIADIFYFAEVISKQPRPADRRLMIITNAGGPGVLTTDALIKDGGQLSEISDETMDALNDLLPAAWSHANPIDILGDATPETFAKSLEIAAKDPNADGLLVVLSPQAMTDPTKTAEYLVPYADLDGKPVIASWMGGESVEEGARIMAQAGIPNFPFPDTAVQLFNYMWKYAYSLRGLYEVPSPAQDVDGFDRETAKQILDEVRSEGREILTETESKAVLAAYDIPTIPMNIAETADEAVAAADSMTYPVVVKLNSETITHKSDVGGVRLNLQNSDEVRSAFEAIERNVAAKYSEADFNGVSVQPMIKLDNGYEIIIGSSLDPQFGPVLLFGTGGTLVEVYKDRALGLPPLTTTLARRMIEQTKIAEALKGVRGRNPVDMDLMEKIMVRFSQLIVENPWIKEMDINPLFADENQILALDARSVLHPADTNLENDVPKTAIRPYPVQYVDDYVAPEGKTLRIRPIRPEDEPLAVDFHMGLSEQTVKLRYMYNFPLEERITHERLAAVTFIDYDREIALVAIDEVDGKEKLVAVGRLEMLSGTKEVGEFGILVADDYQRMGLGSALLERLLEIGKQEGVKRVFGKLLIQNQDSVKFLHNFGFTTAPIDSEDGILMGVKDL